MSRVVLLLSWLALVGTIGCDSLVSGECQPGMIEVAGQCRVASPEGLDGPIDPSDAAGSDARVADAAPRGDGGSIDGAGGDAANVDATTATDAPVCTADVQTDPMNCGACGVVCPTGICVAATCVGTPAGHAVMIGHDYRESNLASARVLGNSIGLSTRTPIRIFRWPGTAALASITGTDQAMTTGLALVGRPYSYINADGVEAATEVADVIVIYAQRGDAGAMDALGASWQPALAGFLATGGVVVVLEGEDGTSYRLASAGGLVAVSAIDTATGSVLSIAQPADGTATGVPAPYAAAASSVWFTTATQGVVVDESDHAVVIHSSM